MSTVSLSAYYASVDGTEKVSATTHNLAMQAIQNLLNNITSDQITEGTLTLDRVEGGAVPESDVTTAGSSAKIVKTTSSAHLKIADGGGIEVQLG